MVGMTVTTSARLNPDQLQVALAAIQGGASFASTGAELNSTDAKSIRASGATDTQLQQAVTTAAGQFVDYAANAATIQANIQTHLRQIETWLAANPSGAVLTAAQTAQLARMLVGVGRILLNLTSTVGQA